MLLAIIPSAVCLKMRGNCSTYQRRGNGRNIEGSDQILFGLGSSVMSLSKFYISRMSGLSPNAQWVLENTEANTIHLTMPGSRIMNTLIKTYLWYVAGKLPKSVLAGIYSRRLSTITCKQRMIFWFIRNLYVISERIDFVYRFVS